MSDGKNFPEPKTNADRIAMKAAELLDQDVWERVSDEAVWVRGIRITLETHNGYVTVPVDPVHDATVLNYERPASEIASIFMTAFKGAMARRREIILVPKVAQINDPAWRQLLATEERKKLWREYRKTLAWVLLWLGLFAGVVGGISSCVVAAERAELADANQVNEYGFRKGDFAYEYQFEFPDTCARIPAYASLRKSECAERFREREKDGNIWVSWDNKP